MKNKTNLKITALFICFSLISTTLGCVSTNDQAVRNLSPDELERFSANQKAGQLQDVKKIGNVDPQAREIKGDNLVRKNQITAALFEYNRALKAADDISALRLRLKMGQIYLRLHQYYQAESQYQAILEKDPSEARALQGLGLAYLSQNRLDLAKAPLSKATENDPKLWKSFNALGVIYNREQKPEQAISAFTKAIRINPTISALYNNRGLSLMIKGDYFKAETEFFRALRLNPKHKLALNNLGLLYAKQGKWSLAQKYFEISLGKAKAHHNLGILMANQGMKAKAVDQFNRAMEQSPSFYEKADQSLKQVQATPYSYSPIKRQPIQSIEENSSTKEPVRIKQNTRRIQKNTKTEIATKDKLKQTLKGETQAQKTPSNQSPTSADFKKEKTDLRPVAYEIAPDFSQDIPATIIKEPARKTMPEPQSQKTIQYKPKSPVVRMPMPQIPEPKAKSSNKKRVFKSMVRMSMPPIPKNLPKDLEPFLPTILADNNKPQEKTIEEAQKPVFYVQVATLRSKAKAEKLKKNLSKQGKKVKVEPWKSQKKLKYQRVLLGPYNTETQAKTKAEDLRKKGVAPILVARLNG